MDFDNLDIVFLVPLDKQVDVLPSKNQALCKLINCYSILINDIISKSCEHRFITKGHITSQFNSFVLTDFILQYFSDKSRPKFLL